MGDTVMPSVPQVMLIQSGGVVDETASESSGWDGSSKWLFQSSRVCGVCGSGIKHRAVCFCLGVWDKNGTTTNLLSSYYVLYCVKCWVSVLLMAL